MSHSLPCPPNLSEKLDQQKQIDDHVRSFLSAGGRIQNCGSYDSKSKEKEIQALHKRTGLPVHKIAKKLHVSISEVRYALRNIFNPSIDD